MAIPSPLLLLWYRYITLGDGGNANPKWNLQVASVFENEVFARGQEGGRTTSETGLDMLSTV